jgi:hypothetical protein
MWVYMRLQTWKESKQEANGPFCSYKSFFPRQELIQKEQAGHNVGCFCIQPVCYVNAIWACNNLLKVARQFDASSGDWTLSVAE